MGVFIIQQQISAGNDFDGTLPAGVPAYDKDIKRFPSGTAGGLFDFEITGPHEIFSIELILGGQSAWSISKEDSDGDEIVLWAGTSEASFVTLLEDRIQITEEETLLVRTTGASAALKCRIAVKKID